MMRVAKNVEEELKDDDEDDGGRYGEKGKETLDLVGKEFAACPTMK
ncbi:hypothetical protein L195_g033209 [Trifolium pratense]|uniref:Uncharacterized protein n=1 Tax=Trifolium pratense TaxID=57577 RepID=A0A2K3LFE1_TRIPR|nr:hypothetical protein L195_g033209 [Trifolium pratense]